MRSNERGSTFSQGVPSCGRDSNQFGQLVRQVLDRHWQRRLWRKPAARLRDRRDTRRGFQSAENERSSTAGRNEIPLHGGGLQIPWGLRRQGTSRVGGVRQASTRGLVRS